MQAVKNERILHILIGLSIVALGLVIADSLQDKVVKVGDKAPDFSVKTEAGLNLTCEIADREILSRTVKPVTSMGVVQFVRLRRLWKTDWFGSPTYPPHPGFWGRDHLNCDSTHPPEMYAFAATITSWKRPR